MIMGSYSFRRNAITDTVNATNGNVELADQIYGNSPRVAKYEKSNPIILNQILTRKTGIIQTNDIILHPNTRYNHLPP